MNCFHFSVSLRYTTTVLNLKPWNNVLWIAFIFQYLWDTQQHKIFNILFYFCCELLSFFSIFEIHNNLYRWQRSYSSVVNCFHFSVSLRYTTTNAFESLLPCVLWIAFIFQYLWDTQQHLLVYITFIYSCELLSFFSIFEIHNNRGLRVKR